MTKNFDRHASIGSSSSWRSSDTVRGPFRSRPPVTVRTSKDANNHYLYVACLPLWAACAAVAATPVFCFLGSPGALMGMRSYSLHIPPSQSLVADHIVPFPILLSSSYSC